MSKSQTRFLKLVKGTGELMKSHPNSKVEPAIRKNTCLRCGGYLVKEDFVDLAGTCEPPVSMAWRCMNCGNVVDQLILHHRQTPPPRPIRGGCHSREG